MRILKNEYKDSFCGYYLPSVFYMEINTDNPLTDINDLSDEDKSTFYHEYTHFLQDLTTTFGLTNIINTVNVQKAINVEILKEDGSNEFDVPVSIANFSDTDTYDNLNEMFYGDFDSNFNNNSIITKVEFLENGVILDHEDKEYVKVSYSNFFDSHTFSFGAIQIMENMAFLIERNLCDNVSAPVYPYRIVEKIIEHLYPKLKPNDTTIVMICDYSLMTPDPGKFLVEFVLRLKEMKVYSLDNIYSVFKEYQFSSVNSENTTVFKLYQDRSELALKSVKEYFTIELFEEVRNWLDTIFDQLGTYRLENFNFWRDILELPTKRDREAAVAKLTRDFGFPLISNNKGNVVFFHPNHYPEYLLALKAINEVSAVLYGAKDPCGMKKCCENGSDGDITNIDCNKPWLRGSQDPLCPFGQIIKMWGINAKIPKPSI